MASISIRTPRPNSSLTTTPVAAGKTGPRYSRRTSLVIMTGYALSDDGIWRAHSWGVDLTTGDTIETTDARWLYFGFRLSPDEAERFSTAVR